MKILVFVSLAVAAVNFSSAEDDGQYRPGKYGGDDGRYRHVESGGDEGRYDAYRFGENFKNRKYASIFSASQPVVYRTYSPFQNLIAPIVDNRVDYSPLASSLSAANYRPVAVAPSPIASAYARAQYNNDRYAKIIRQDVDVDANAYHYLYQTDNGINAEESGSVDAAGSVGGTRASGFFEYVGDDGVKYRVDYVADENGFQPRGAHLPQ